MPRGPIRRTCQLRWLASRRSAPTSNGTNPSHDVSRRDMLFFGCLSRTAGQCDGAAPNPLKELGMGGFGFLDGMRISHIRGAILQDCLARTGLVLPQGGR